MATTLDAEESIRRGLVALREALDLDRTALVTFDDPEPGFARVRFAETAAEWPAAPMGAVIPAGPAGRALCEEQLRGPDSPEPVALDMKGVLASPTLRALGTRGMLGVGLRPGGPHLWLLDAQRCREEPALGDAEMAVLIDVGRCLTLQLSALWHAEQHEREAERFHAIADCTPMGIFSVEGGQVTYANERFWEILGRSAGGETDLSALLGLEELPDAEHGPHHHVVELPPPRISARDVEISCAPLRARGGARVGTLLDVTDSRATRAQAIELAKMSALGAMVGGVAHHFNNLLAGVLGNIYVLEDLGNWGSSERDALADMRDSGERAADLVRQLMTFARKGPSSVTERDLVPLVRSTVETMDLATPRHIRVDGEFVDDELVALVDVSAVQEIVLNLVTNARLAIESKGPGVIRVTLNYEPASEVDVKRAPHGWAQLTVEDQGVGISAEVLPHVFEPFFTTREVGQGVGMGLATVYGAVGRMGGKVSIESEVDRSTCVKVCIPLVETSIAHTPPEASVLPGHGETILLVDDDETVRNVLTRVLRHLGYEAVACVSAGEAIAAFEAEPTRFAAVLSDVMMPNMNGYELAKALREIRVRVPVLLMTSYDPEGLKGLDDVPGELPRVLEKPINLRKLAGALARALIRS